MCKSTSTRRVYVASPLRGDIEGNQERACGYCREVAKLGLLPYAPHLFFTQFLDDTDPDQREIGMALALMELERCDELWVFGRLISSGMAREIEHAAKHGIPVVFRSTDPSVPAKWELIDA